MLHVQHVKYYASFAFLVAAAALFVCTHTAWSSSVLESPLPQKIIVFKKDDLPIAVDSNFPCDTYAYASGPSYSMLTNGVYLSSAQPFLMLDACHMPLSHTAILANGKAIGFFRATFAPPSHLVATMPPQGFSILSVGNYSLKNGRKFSVHSNRRVNGAIPR